MLFLQLNFRQKSELLHDGSNSDMCNIQFNDVLRLSLCVSNYFGENVSFYKNCDFVKISLMVQRMGILVASHTLFLTRASCIFAVDVLGFTVLQYSTHSITSGFETVGSFQSGLSGSIDPNTETTLLDFKRFDETNEAYLFLHTT